MEILELTWQMDGVAAGTDDSAENPLARATDCLFRQGRPFSRLSKCFFRGPDGIVRWLGIFVHSAGDRIIFFPGFAESQTYVTGYADDALRWSQSFQIDHLSLEPDRLSWHFTEPQSADHLGKMYTIALGPRVVHWFNMSVISQEDLRIARKNTLVSAPTPSRDIDRRIDVFVRAREGALFQLVELNKEHPLAPAPNFLHFSIVVGPSGFESPCRETFGVPYGSPLHNVSTKSLGEVPIRVHRVSLSDDVDIEITSALLPGILQMRYIFSGGHTPQREAHGVQV